MRSIYRKLQSLLLICPIIVLLLTIYSSWFESVIVSAEGQVEHQKRNQPAISMAGWFRFWCSTRLVRSVKKCLSYRWKAYNGQRLIYFNFIKRNLSKIERHIKSNCPQRLLAPAAVLRAVGAHVCPRWCLMLRARSACWRNFAPLELVSANLAASSLLHSLTGVVLIRAFGARQRLHHCLHGFHS